MPDELKQSPGYRPFTLGVDAQAWVDSMAEIVDGGGGVYGRPRPVAPTQHRSLTAPSPPSPPTQRDWPPFSATPPPSPPPRSTAPSVPRISMPDIDAALPPAAPRTLPRRVTMPNIGEDEGNPAPRPRQPRMPEIDSEETPSASHPRQVSMPDIDGDNGKRPSPREQRASMPEIDDESECLPPSRPLMPDIG